MTDSLNDYQHELIRQYTQLVDSPFNPGGEDIRILRGDGLSLIQAIEKAYGACHLCYGKGYATYREGTIAYGDFEGEKDVITPPETEMRFCECDRGKQLEDLILQREAEARKEGEQRALDCISIDMGFWASRYNIYTETLGLPHKSHDYVDNLHLKKHEFPYPKDIELRRRDG